MIRSLRTVAAFAPDTLDTARRIAESRRRLPRLKSRETRKRVRAVKRLRSLKSVIVIAIAAMALALAAPTASIAASGGHGGPAGGHQGSGGHPGQPGFSHPSHPAFHGYPIHRGFVGGHPRFIAPGFAFGVWPAYPYLAYPYAAEPGYWYYCPSAGAYYPTVPSCPEPWVPVPAS
jgi:hypothetical protein